MLPPQLEHSTIASKVVYNRQVRSQNHPAVHLTTSGQRAVPSAAISAATIEDFLAPSSFYQLVGQATCCSTCFFQFQSRRILFYLCSSHSRSAPHNCRENGFAALLAERAHSEESYDQHSARSSVKSCKRTREVCASPDSTVQLSLAGPPGYHLSLDLSSHQLINVSSYHLV